MSRIDVVVDQGMMNRLTRTLRAVPGGLKRVIPPAINKTATQGRTRAARRISKASGIKVGEVRKRIRIQRATRMRWAAALRLSNKRLPLILFSARQTVARGVTYRLGGATRSRLAHGFIAVMPSGHRGVYMRKWQGDKRAGRLPIVEQMALSVAGVYSKGPQVAAEVMRETRGLLRTNIDRQVRYVLMKA